MDLGSSYYHPLSNRLQRKIEGIHLNVLGMNPFFSLFPRGEHKVIDNEHTEANLKKLTLSLEKTKDHYFRSRQREK